MQELFKAARFLRLQDKICKRCQNYLWPFLAGVAGNLQFLLRLRSRCCMVKPDVITPHDETSWGATKGEGRLPTAPRQCHSYSAYFVVHIQHSIFDFSADTFICQRVSRLTCLRRGAQFNLQQVYCLINCHMVNLLVVIFSFKRKLRNTNTNDISWSYK